MSKPKTLPDRDGTPSAAPAAAVARPARSAKAPRERAWSEVASFVIHFERRASGGDGAGERRIAAHKMQDGGITARWTGPAQQPMMGWIAEHLDGDWSESPGPAPVLVPGLVPAPVPATAPTAVAAPAALVQGGSAGPASPGPLTPSAAAGRLAITDVRARPAGAARRAAAGRAGPQARTQLRGGDAFGIEARVEIVGAGAATTATAPADAAACKVEFFGRDLTTRQSVRLGEAAVDPLAVAADADAGAAGAVCAGWARLSGLALPPGTYRVDSIASLAARPAVLAHAEGPLLDVR